MKNKSKILALALLTITLNSNFSNAQIIDQTVNEIPLSSSINFKKIVENYGSSSNVFNMLEVDLSNPNNSIDVLINSSGLSNTLSIQDASKSTPNLVSASNADFFLMQKPTSSIGPIVKNHRVLSSPAEQHGKYASMVVTDDNKVTFEYLNPYVVLKNITTSKDYTVYAMNKVLSDSFKGITIRTSDFSYSTFGKNTSNPKRVEVLVGSDNIVKEVREGDTYTQIPYGGFAIMSYNIDGSVLKNNFKVGDNVSVSLDIMLQRPNIKTVIGGGSVLIKNGAKTPITSSIPGKAQRTAAGITKDNKLVIFTNDGRLANSAGLDEKDIQNYMFGLGFKDAIIFDGGGSTELFVDGKIQNFQYSERKVINALAVKNENQTGNVSKVTVAPLKNLIYTGDNVEIIASAQDENGSKVTKYNTPDFMITTSGFNSQIKNRVVVPTTAGTGTINATVKGVTGTAIVTVLPSKTTDDKYIAATTSQQKKFNVFPNMDDGSDLISKVFKSMLIGASKDNENNIIIGNNDNYFSKSLKGHSTIVNANSPNKALDTSIVVSMNNTANISSNPSQWNNLKTALNSQSKNIIIAMQGGASLKSQLEQDVFDKLLEKVAQTKNIYVIYKGNSNEGYKRGNVSYISTVDLKKQNYSNLTAIQYLQFYENEKSDLVYNFKSLVK